MFRFHLLQLPVGLYVGTTKSKYGAALQVTKYLSLVCHRQGHGWVDWPTSTNHFINSANITNHLYQVQVVEVGELYNCNAFSNTVNSLMDLTLPLYRKLTCVWTVNKIRENF